MAEIHKINFVGFVLSWTLIQHAHIATQQYTNLALKKPVKQSSTYENYNAERAVDGIRDRGMKQGSCTHTEPHGKWHWWYVDLTDIYTIDTICIANRAGCCYDRLKDITVEVSLENPAGLDGFPQRTNVSVVCTTILSPIDGDVCYPCTQPVTGRYVRLVKDTRSSHSALTMCEVDIYEHGKSNIALGKPVKQSSTLRPYSAENAVDGNRDGNMLRGSCSHTKSLADWHWWMVDLGKVFIINSIYITNRQDCCQKRLYNFTVEVSVDYPETLAGFPQRTNAEVCVNVATAPSKEKLYQCNKPEVGRYVRVVKKSPENKSLSLCEFEVFGQLRMIGEKVKGGNRLWAFVQIAEYGPTNILKSSSAKRLINGCLRMRLKENMDQATFYLILVELPSGNCRYLQSFTGQLENQSSSWVVIRLV